MHAHHVSAGAGRLVQACGGAVLAGCNVGRLGEPDCDKEEWKLGDAVRVQCGMNLIAAPPRVRLLGYAFWARLRSA